MKTVKAKIIKVSGGDYVPVIYISGRWRAFGTPYSPKEEGFVPHTKKQNAIKCADGMASDIGITLKWEVSVS